MAGPFPGMDPYIEALGSWSDFHTTAIVECRRALVRTIPRHYVPRIDERVVLISDDDERQFEPDVLIARQRQLLPDPSITAGVAVATIEPVTLDIPRPRRRKARLRRLEILKAPEMKLVTVIEMLSPANKVGQDRVRYLAKRREWLDGGVHLVELDLLLRGRRMPFEGDLPPGDYYAVVARADRQPGADVYGWSIRHPLPPIPIPLQPPDRDATLDLGALVATIHDESRYDAILPYDRPLILPLAPEDRAWAEAIARAAGRR